MRVLFAGLSEKSHVNCMVPLAWALTAAGHEVRVVTAPALTGIVTGTGLVAAPVGRDHELHEAMKLAPETQDQELANWSRMGPDEVDWPTIRSRYEIGVPYGFALYNDPVIDDTVALAQSWRPHLVVCDPLAYAGAIAARVSGAVDVRLLWSANVYGRARRTYVDLMGQAPPEERVDPLADWLDERGAPFGVSCDEELINGHYTIDTLPPSLRLPGALRELPMRFVPYNGEAVWWPWLREAPERPRVCLTLGTTNTEAYGGDYVSVPVILDALAGLDIEVVAALLPQQREALGDIPANARAVEGVALDTLLPSCSAVIHHGGFGTFATALVNAVPQLALSTTVADLEWRGRSLERAGAGIFAHHSEVTADLVLRHTRQILDDPGFASAARRLRDESAAMPSPRDMVATLEQLVAER
ncbi:activator-dependent family glycosyltransferase [Streptomyces tubercidicus]|uniref:Glycosyl transferase n=1 Tax=Streptomyces tubercidicus TaxID=47759 RepID=A0A640V0H9_9ACTN|nr:activator-dependent family glycosyltransferase [Streptomyces tubercidicus]WAU15988.1 activator-dependent family glycosyltransferase [Streptomyces tubercidicus]GFE41893.1 glycosyl transferase [Streptomyces tubercidicus]